MLSKEERVYLLKLAREAVIAHFEGKRFVPPPPESKDLLSKSGAFVTLIKDGSLRGCIGTLEGEKPLYQLIPELALSAAFKDPRFPSLEPQEVSKIKIEISILSPLKPAQPSEVEVGKHGIYIVKGWHRGVLLPQVATGHGLSREEFLRLGCAKAGLPEDCLDDPEVRLYVFSAEVFGEEEGDIV